MPGKHTKLPGKARSKPQQSRAMATSLALQEAFVRVLLERGYEKTSVREVTQVAGTGLGTFYEHFRNKAALAAVCIRTRFRESLDGLHAEFERGRDNPFPQVIDAMLDRFVDFYTDDPVRWAELLILERRISDMKAYRSLYAYAVDIWSKALRGTIANPQDLADAAYAAHTIAYSLIFQDILRHPGKVDAPALRRQVRRGVHGYLRAVAPEAYRSNGGIVPAS